MLLPQTPTRAPPLDPAVPRPPVPTQTSESGYATDVRTTSISMNVVIIKALVFLYELTESRCKAKQHVFHLDVVQYC